MDIQSLILIILTLLLVVLTIAVWGSLVVIFTAFSFYPPGLSYFSGLLVVSRIGMDAAH